MQTQPGLVKMTLFQAIEWLLNQALLVDERLISTLAPLDEKVIQLTLSDLKTTAFITFYQQESKSYFAVQTHLIGRPDAHIKTPLKTWFNLKNNLPLPAEQITGNADLAQLFLTTLSQFQWDWEESLSELTGDLVAHQVGSQLRQAKRTGQQAKQQIQTTLKEYLQFEIELLPTQQQVKHFNQSVEQLAQDLETLEAKINKLALTSAQS